MCRGGIVGAQTTTERWERMVADVVVRRAVAASADDVEVAGPEVRYVWTRARGSSGWKTKLVLKSATRPPLQTLDGPVAAANPSPVAWIEDDEDGTPLRLYNKRGERIRPPDAADRRVLGDPIGGPFKFPSIPTAGPGTGIASGGFADDVEIIVFSAGRKEQRRDALRRRFGDVTGRVKGHDRYLKHADNSTIEVLADPEWAVPTEINLVRNGSLVSHITCTYEPGAEGSLTTRSVRGEQRMAKGPFTRIISEVEFTNVRLERRR
jgi:hypothetical protein